MTWIEYHSQSERYAAEAEVAARLGDNAETLRLYKMAADSEASALQEVDPAETPRTFSITSVSAAALYYKAHEWTSAQVLAYRCLGSGHLLKFAFQELEDILDSIKMREVGFGDAHILVSASGGEIVRGGAPLDLIVKKTQQIQALLYRTTEYMLKVPLRKRGAPKKQIQDSYRPWIFQAEPGSYQFRVSLPNERQLDLFNEDIPSTQVVNRLFGILQVCATATHHDEVAEVVAEPNYADTFLKMTRDLAPTRSSIFTNLDIQSPSTGETVILQPNIRPRLNRVIRGMRPPPPNAVHEEVEGVLRALHLDEDWIEVIATDVDGESLRIDGAGEEVDDRIGPLVNQRVVVKFERLGNRRTFIDIEGTED